MVKSHETKSLFMTELRTLRSGKLKCFVKQIKILGRGNSGEEFAFFKEKLFYRLFDTHRLPSNIQSARLEA